MKCIALFVAVAVGVTSTVVPVGAQILQSAERLAREAGVAQLTTTRRVKSKGRMGTGAGMTLAGLVLILYEMNQCAVAGTDADRYTPPLTASYDRDRGECVLDGRLDYRARNVYAEPDPDYRIMSVGGGLAALGLLLATAWADVDANDSLIFDARRNGAVVGKRFTW